jgi:hypothetical protein
MTDNRESGTVESWRRLLEELQRAGYGKFVVTIDGRCPVSVSRITNPVRLQGKEREDE